MVDNSGTLSPGCYSVTPDTICQRMFYKSMPCAYFTLFGYCKKGDFCTYAHGNHELKPIQKVTVCCLRYHRAGFCQFGPKCLYTHETEQSKQWIIDYVLRLSKRCSRDVGREQFVMRTLQPEAFDPKSTKILTVDNDYYGEENDGSELIPADVSWGLPEGINVYLGSDLD